jgi:hypothetical protein
MGQSSSYRNHGMSLEIEFEFYDHSFPNQDTVPIGGFGNLVAVPLQ